MKSPKQTFKTWPKAKQAYIDSLTEQEAEDVWNSWWWTARPEQLPPEGAWRTWLLMMGRGSGKTRAAAEFVIDQIKNHGYRNVALVGRTAGDVRRVMVPAILEVARLRGIEAHHEPSKTLITFGNGAIATTFSAEAGDQLRGPQHDLAWADEVAAWPRNKEDADAWMNLKATLRVGEHPKLVASTTPRPTALIRELVEDEKDKDAGVVISYGSTFDNADNLAPSFIEEMKNRYEGTRIGEQELEGKLLLDIEGALWKYPTISDARVKEPPPLKRVVVAIDPAVSTNKTSDYTVMTVVGIGIDGQFYVLESVRRKVQPNEWATEALELFDLYNADRLIAEKNNGGDMVEFTLRTVRKNAPIKTIHASKGKKTRAEPVAALYEQAKVHHVGVHDDLEAQMIVFPVDGDEHDDLVDSLVYALSELAGLTNKQAGQLITYSRGRRRK